MKHLIFLLVSLLYVQVAIAYEVDLIIFSKHRPLQLYALLESCNRRLKGITSATVIYCVVDSLFDAAYEEVKRVFPEVRFIKQGPNPRADFKPLTLHAIFDSQAPYILFAVDDIVAIDEIDVQNCVQALEAYQAYAFYLRLGLDITNSYMERRKTGIPSLNYIGDNMYLWCIGKSSGEWCYPHSLDMSLYRKRDIKKVFMECDYHSPNTLEGIWAGDIQLARKMNGLCFGTSKTINLPLNLVQTDCNNNRNMASLDAYALLAKFQQGFKIDVQALYRLSHSAPHVEYIPPFVRR